MTKAKFSPGKSFDIRLQLYHILFECQRFSIMIIASKRTREMFIDATNVIEHKYCSSRFRLLSLMKTMIRCAYAFSPEFTFSRNNTKSETQLICRIMCNREVGGENCPVGESSTRLRGVKSKHKSSKGLQRVTSHVQRWHWQKKTLKPPSNEKRKRYTVRRDEAREYSHV